MRKIYYLCAMNKIDKETAALLWSEAERINSPAFIGEDPVQFPRRFSDVRDIEIAALLSAIMAWGNRKMICRDIERLLQLMDGQPYAFMAEGAFRELPDDMNIHRTLFGRHLKHFLNGLKEIYLKHGSLDAFSKSIESASKPLPSWFLAEEMQKVITEANGGEECSRCLPLNFSTTALKRFNMALRWLVRDDGIVDMGVWNSIPKSKLYIPLDVHVGNVSRELGLLERKANDKKSVIELTDTLRTINPEDPCLFDYALFGIGIESNRL